VRRLAVAVAAVAVAASALAPGVAAAAYVTSVSVYSDPGDPIGYGQQYVLDLSNAYAIGAHVDGEELTVSAVRREGPSVDPIRPGGFSFTFTAPTGQALQPGVYVGATRHPFNEPGQPGMDADGVRGCNELRGRFEIKDLEVRGEDVVRLWAVYHLYCLERSPDSVFGEIRVGAWVPRVARAMAPGIVRWPPLDAWRRATPVPVTYRGGAPVADVKVVGEHAADFPADATGCAGRRGPCPVTVAFVPTAAGARAATLRVTDARGGVHETRLEGFAQGGTTLVDAEVHISGAGAGRRVFRPEDATFNGQVFAPQVELYVERNDEEGTWLNASFGGGGATPLAVGHYPDAEGSLAPTPWLEVIGRSIHCQSSGGEFTVHSISRMPEGTLRTFDVTFRQNCGDKPGVTGRWQFRAGGEEPLAAWMLPGPRPGVRLPASARRSVLEAHCLPAFTPRAARRRGTPRADQIRGRPGSDLVLAGGGDDRVSGRGGNDCLGGGDGNDRLSGGPGDDLLRGEAGDDHLVGGPGEDVLVCGPGEDIAVVDTGDRVGDCERVRRTGD
jgi:RTX calcium-binding nonapeptide repeat (4 copies)